MRTFFRYVLSLAIALIGVWLYSPSARAATVTVCASGCGYTSIRNAMDSEGTEGTIYNVQASYDATGETWPIIFPTVSSTIDCDSGATLNQNSSNGNNRIYLSTSSTIRGCTFGNISISTNATGLGDNTEPSGISIINNIFSTSATSSIDFTNGATNFDINGNTNINLLVTRATTTNGYIRNNTFYGRMFGQTSSGILDISHVTTSQIQVLNNIITSYATDPGASGSTVGLGGSDIVFATNTLRYAVPMTATGLETSLFSSASGTVYIGGNFIEAPTKNSQCIGINIMPMISASWSATYTVRQNTILGRGACTSLFAVKASDGGFAGLVNASISIYNNIFDNETPSEMANAAVDVSLSTPSTFSESNDYNGAYRFSSTVKYVEDGLATITTGPNSLTSKPMLKLEDADATNDLVTSPFSAYLDVNGSVDIGATSGARRNTITIDATGTVDYSSVDATTTAHIPQFVKSGDSIAISAGNYPGFAINSSIATSSISITGVGASTILYAASDADALSFTNVSSSSITDLQVRNASSSGSATYNVTRINLRHGSTNYNDAIPGLGLPSNATILIEDNLCNATPYLADGRNISSLVGGATQNFDIVLGDIGGGSKETLLIRSDLYASTADLETACAGSIGLNVEYAIPNAFTVSSGVYTYHADGTTSLIGGASTPEITRTVPIYAGIKLAGTSNSLTITRVTSSYNGYGILFSTSNNGSNTLTDSVLSNNTSYDVRSLSNSTNTFDNVNFTRTSNSIEGTGSILAKFKLRGQALRHASSAAIIGATMVATDASGTETSLGTTGAGGYTSYVSLPAYTLTQSSSALTNGGYNTYTLNASSTGYSTTSTSVSLASANQGSTLRFISTIAPSAPTSASASVIGSTTSTLSWSDNSDDETQFSIQVRNVTVGESFPGSSFTADGDATSYTLTGLIPNQTYIARVRAVGPGGNSSYSTSTAFVTRASIAATPTVTEASRTSVTVSIGTDGNSSSTEYSLYSSTLGSYLDASGVSSAVAVWQTTSTWGTVTVSNLTCGTTYAFSVNTRNSEGTVSATSTEGSASTSACPSSSGGGGGGSTSGSVNAPSTIFILTPITPAIPPVSTPAFPLSSVIPPATIPALPSMQESIPLPSSTPVSTEARNTATNNAQRYGVRLTTQEQEAIGRFIEQGTTSRTRQLGAGERQALLRDLLDTLRHAPTIEDLERNAAGQLPLSRNLTQERLQLPRVRQTFRSIYGHDPNFQNREENLAWNTLMYRMRFPRDLEAEREGIQEFRTLFHRNPTDPFQWATVRALGYVQR